MPKKDNTNSLWIVGLALIIIAAMVSFIFLHKTVKTQHSSISQPVTSQPTVTPAPHALPYQPKVHLIGIDKNK